MVGVTRKPYDSRTSSPSKKPKVIHVTEPHFVADNRWHTLTVSLDQSRVLFWIDSFSVLKGMTFQRSSSGFSG